MVNKYLVKIASLSLKDKLTLVAGGSVLLGALGLGIHKGIKYLNKPKVEDSSNKAGDLLTPLNLKEMHYTNTIEISPKGYILINYAKHTPNASGTGFKSTMSHSEMYLPPALGGQLVSKIYMTPKS